MSEDRWAGTAWQVVSVGEVPVTGAATVAFDDEGRVFGRSVVNRFFGTYVVDGVSLVLGPLGSTMMAGSPEVMAEEQLMLTALTGTLTVEEDTAAVADQGAITLRGSSTLRLVPAAAGPGRTV